MQLRRCGPGEGGNRQEVPQPSRGLSVKLITFCSEVNVLISRFISLHQFLRLVLLPLTLVVGGHNVFAATSEEVFRLPSGVEVISQRYPAVSEVLVIWLTGQYGRTEEEHKAAADMAAQGVETWVTDFLAPYFLPLLPSSWNQIPDTDLAEWLEAVRQRHDDRRIVLVSSGRVSSLVLRAARSWQIRYGQAHRKAVEGALLMYPLLYQDLTPGQEPDYDPIVNETRLDLVILQPKSSAGYWWRDRLKDVLEVSGSRVWMQVLPGLRDGFYRRSDITAQETAAGARLGQMLLEGLKPLLNKEKQ